jgi:hypothetical protein
MHSRAEAKPTHLEPGFAQWNRLKGVVIGGFDYGIGSGKPHHEAAHPKSGAFEKIATRQFHTWNEVWVVRVCYRELNHGLRKTANGAAV